MKLSYSCFDTVAFAGVTKETMFLHNGLDFFVLLGIAPDVDDDAAKDKPSTHHPRAPIMDIIIILCDLYWCCRSLTAGSWVA